MSRIRETQQLQRQQTSEIQQHANHRNIHPQKKKKRRNTDSQLIVEPLVRKLRSRNVGKDDDWNPPAFEDSPKKKNRKKRKSVDAADPDHFSRSSRKTGTRDVNPHSGWKRPKFEEKIKASELPFTQVHNTVRKQGPREIGITRGWSRYKPNVPYEELVDMRPRTSSYTVPIVRKLGPREIGTVKGWKAYKYDPQESKPKSRNVERRNTYSVPRKLGPRDYSPPDPSCWQPPPVEWQKSCWSWNLPKPKVKPVLRAQTMFLVVPKRFPTPILLNHKTSPKKYKTMSPRRRNKRSKSAPESFFENDFSGTPEEAPVRRKTKSRASIIGVFDSEPEVTPLRVSKKMKTRTRLEDVFEMGSPDTDEKQDDSGPKKRRVMFSDMPVEI